MLGLDLWLVSVAADLRLLSRRMLMPESTSNTTRSIHPDCISRRGQKSPRKRCPSSNFELRFRSTVRAGAFVALPEFRNHCTLRLAHLSAYRSKLGEQGRYWRRSFGRNWRRPHFELHTLDRTFSVGSLRLQ